MKEPLLIDTERFSIGRLVELAEELANDVIVYADREYSKADRENYPTIKRRHQRDTESAREVLKLTAEISGSFVFRDGA